MRCARWFALVLVCGSGLAGGFESQAWGVTIGGHVRTSGGAGISGVTVTANEGGGSDTTDSNGHYSLTVASHWSGTVTPSKSHYAFSPASRSYANVTSNQTGQDFTGTEIATIRGYTSMRLAGGDLRPVDGVTLTADSGGGSATTASDGSYSITVPCGWSGTITPSPSSSCYFDPTSRRYTNVTSSLVNQDFRWLPYDIIGFVSLPDVTTPLSDPVRITASNGGGEVSMFIGQEYAISVTRGWSGRITPTHPYYTFSPPYRDYSNVTSYLLEQNFTGTRKSVTISGYVRTSAGSGIPNVAVSATNGGGSTTTNSSGSYSYTVPCGWSGRVTPSHGDYSISPPYKDYSNVTSDLSNWIFTATLKTYTLTINAANGTVTRSPNKATYNVGETVTLTPNPNSCYHFGNWSGDASGTANPLTITMDTNKTVTANFAVNTYTLTINATNGSVTRSPNKTTYNCGETVILTPSANSGYRFANWSGDASGTANPLTITMDGNKTVTANFAINTYALTVNASNGSVARSPNKTTYNAGETVTLTPNPNSCYRFANWSGDASGTANPLTVTMNGNKTITANFVLNTYTLTVNATNGSVSRSPNKTTYNCGETVTLTPSPNSCYRFSNWSGNASGTANPLTITMDANKTITANFAINTYTLTVSATNGLVTRSPNKTTYNCGETVTLTANANSCYRFGNWSGDASGTTRSLTITMNGNKTVTANFALNTYTLTINATNGSVTRSPNMTTYDCGETVTLTPNPNSCYHFANWSGDASGTTTPLTITMNGDMTITANFAIDQYVLTVSSTAGGMVGTPGIGTFQYDCDTTVTLEATAKPNFVFAGWSGDCSSVDSPASFTITSDCQVKANFVSLLDIIYVDSDALNDPEPNDVAISDPNEDGTPQHPFDSIQEAVEVARQGVGIVVDGGLYRERIDLTDKTIILRGLWPSDPNRAGAPVLDGGGAGTVVTFGADANSVLIGFQIQGGKAHTGAALLCTGGSATLSNCLIVGNRVDRPDGGVIDCRNGNLVLLNCTISGNAGVPNAAVLCVPGSKVLMSNSIIWGNTPPRLTSLAGPLFNTVYCDIEGAWPGAGNLNIDPLFAVPGHWNDLGTAAIEDDTWTPGDYHLLSRTGRWDPVPRAWVIDGTTSPCIDRGDPAADYLFEPQPHGGRINLGAYGGTPQASKSP
jgi:uncharacterized repeat protein (TIGR02543 family)